jgi:adenylate cyclase
VTDAEPGGRAASIGDWLLGEGRRFATAGDLLGALCARLLAEGVPLDRAGLHIRTLNPQVRGSRLLWQQGVPVPLETSYGFDSTVADSYERSPLYRVQQTGETVRRRLADPVAEDDFPIVAELRAEGITDYVVLPLVFGSGQIQAATWASRHPDGFEDRHLRALRDLLPALAALLEAHELRRTTRTLLETYLGQQAGRRVLNGTIRRGDGQTLAAALWYCDLRGFTAMSNELPRDELIAVLNDYFECVTGPVHAHGGEVLKFIGDSVLAIFPIADDLDRDRACRTALAAAEAALADLGGLNAARRAAGKSGLAVGIGLHVGGVMYGNIGAPNRLDFTVVGPAVNMVTRIEGLCVELGRALLASAMFASPCGSKLVPVGHYRLKGIADPQEIFGLP